MTHIPELTFTIQIFSVSARSRVARQEGRTYVAYTPELDVSSCGRTVDKARGNLGDAVRGFLKSAARVGTINAILHEAVLDKKS